MRSIALGRKSWMFAGSYNGGEYAVITFSLIETTKLNGINQQEYLIAVLTKIKNRNDK